MSAPSGPPTTGRGRGDWATTPTRPIGWAGVVAAVVAVLSATVLLPLITTLFREIAPITDTALMPVIGVVLLIAAAVLNVVALWPARQRNVLTLIATLVTVPTAFVFTTFLVGEALSGV